MGKGKLAKFAKLDAMPHVVQPSKDEILNGLPLRGAWKRDFFKSDRPLVVELGCGHGEYTLALARLEPDKNYLGIDIKGARMCKGAEEAQNSGLKQVGFLRTRIEWIEHAFAPGEIDELWITFPDPQIKYQRTKHRMVNPAFLERYQRLLRPGGLLHLKTDSEFLHGYLLGILSVQGHEVLESCHDVYLQLQSEPQHAAFACQTYYERIFLKKGKLITYLKFRFK
jgi:tRNA (guanine-N7-)-methyltransferase